MSNSKEYFIRSSLVWSDPWGELSDETGILCYVKECDLLKCYKLVKEKTLKEFRGHDLLITIGFVHGQNKCDIIYTTLKCYEDFDAKNIIVIDKDVNFSGFRYGMHKLVFDGMTFKNEEDVSDESN